MKISPKYSDSDFTKAHKAGDWTNLVEIFSDRLNGRYLKPIELIQNGNCEISEFSGFSILSLDCVLIETLTQFDTGAKETPYRKVKQSFVSFLTTKDNFKKHFKNDDTAKIFYDHFRNGLLHQAQTKDKSLIKIGQSKMVTKIEGGLIIDRILFHQAIVDEINNYKSQLISGEDNKVKRENFITKMKFICGCE